MNVRKVARAIATAGAVGGLVLGACGGGNSPDPGASQHPRLADAPLDPAQGQVLAGVLHSNYLEGGARFSADAEFAAIGDRIELDGRVDWTTHSGHAEVHAVGSEAHVAEVTWTPERVYERVPELGGRADGSVFVERAPAPGDRLLDVVLGTVIGLAAETPDNPQLVRQDPTARFLRRATVDGVPVDVFAYRASTYSIDDTGHLQQIEIESADGSHITIRLHALEPQQIHPVDDSHTVTLDELAGAYPPAVG